MSGISLTWYTWLEQGRNIPATSQVVDALARALLLGPDDHHYLRMLAGLIAPGPETPAADVQPRLQRLADSLAPNLASVYDAHFDYLAWNTPYLRVRHDPSKLPLSRRNLLWMMFTDAENRNRMTRWEPAARAVLSQLRAATARRPGDPRFTEIVSALTKISPEFRNWWAEYPVRHFRPATIGIEHPRAGRITLDMFQFHPVEHPDLLIVMQVPATSADLDRVTSLLTSPTADSHGHGSPPQHRDHASCGLRTHRTDAS